MSDQEKGPCTICRGSYSEHFDDQGNPITQHAYTAQEGDLVTHEQAKKRSEQPRQTINPAMIMAGAHSPLAMQRLVEVLMDKGLLSEGDALYIAGFTSTKPNASPSFRDPAETSGFYRATPGGGI